MKKNKPPVRRQHIVPRFFLRNYFHTTDNNYELITVSIVNGVKNKDTNTITESCYEEYFYNSPFNEDVQELETFFGEVVEPQYAKMQRQIIESVNTSVIHPIVKPQKIEIDKHLLSQFLISQMSRSRKTNDFMHEQAPEIINDLVEEYKIKFPDISVTLEDEKKAVDRVNGDIKNNLLLDIAIKHGHSEDGLQKIIHFTKRNWIIYHTNVELPLSEDIIIPVDLKTGKVGYYLAGIENCEVILVQISKYIIIFMYHPKYYLNSLHHAFDELDLHCVNLRYNTSEDFHKFIIRCINSNQNANIIYPNHFEPFI